MFVSLATYFWGKITKKVCLDNPTRGLTKVGQQKVFPNKFGNHANKYRNNFGNPVNNFLI